MLKSLELFAGAGGLAIGTTMAGFNHEAVIEWNQSACETIRENQKRGSRWVANWPLYEMDVSTFDFTEMKTKIDLIAGGPSCQPFSLGGKHRGEKDERNIFPEVFRAVRETKPRVVLIENVKGLLRKSFSEYFEYIVLQLTYPELNKKSKENWWKHLSRLERHHTGKFQNGLTYKVLFRLLNAADYGVPQRRERLFIVALRSDQRVEWSFPDPTHSQDSLLRDQWIDGFYWDKHKVSKKDRPEISDRIKARVDILKVNHAAELTRRPWTTVRDAISDLPTPGIISRRCPILNHDYQAGACAYQGHTGSPLDEPAKTLKAGNHGVPGGENMIAYPNGKIRYFTVRESARLQTFPDDYVFLGSWTESMRQLGNAVPVSLARIIAINIRQMLKEVR